MPPSSPAASVAAPTDHPPAGVHSLWRLRGYLRPHLLALAVMLGTALAGVGLTITIPLVTKAIIDGPITDRELDGVLPLGLLALALGVLEAVLIFWRRWVQSDAVLGLETEIRHDLYERLQELPMSFHTKWQSGQLLSRATTGPLRDPAVQRLRAAVPGHQHPPGHRRDRRAAAPVLAARPGRRRHRRSRSSGCRCASRRRYVVVSRRVQDEQGDLATRGRGGRGRHPGDQVVRPRRARLRSSTTTRRASSTAPRWTRSGSSARFWTFLEVIPNLAVVVVLLLGAIGVGQGELTPGELVAFITLLLSLVWPVASLGVILAMAQEAMTASRPDPRDLRHRARHRRRRPGRDRRAARPPALRGRRLRLPRRARRARCCATSTSTSRPARPSRWSAPPARARRADRAGARGSTT